MGETVNDFNLGPADETSHRLGKEQVATQIHGQPVTAINLITASRGEMIESLVLGTEAVHAALHIRQADNRPDLHEIG